MHRVRTPLALVLGSLAFAGCGAASAPESAVPAGEPSLRVAAELSEGRTGEATRAAGRDRPRRLAPGGALDASDPPAGPGRRDGVAAGETCVDSELAPVEGALKRLEAATVCLLNGERADHGLPPLTVEARLSRAAARHAADMVARSYFAHEGADGSDIKERIQATGYLPSDQRWVIGENLAWGTGALATPEAIVNAWMNSAGHRANVLHAEYREIGFGIALGNPKADNGFGATYANAFGMVGDAATERAATVRRAAAARKRAAVRRRSARQARAARAARARVARVRASRV